MVRIYMVGGSTVDVNNASSCEQIIQEVLIESGLDGWVHVIDRAGNGNTLKIEHIAHIREV